MTEPPNDQAPLGQEVFGPYLVFERLGVGGMATVHRAKERGIEGFERIVALKRLLPHLAEDASFVKSFVREAKLASMLQHANIVQLYELGRVGHVYFISMEHIDGRDVRKILRQARKVTGPPTINVTVVAATANEAGPVNGTFRISRSTTSSSALTIGYTLSGSALNGTDYTTLPTSATIPAGAAFVDVQVAPVDDTLVESNETVVLTLQPSGGIVLGSPTTGTVTIVSDDVAPDMTVSTLTVPGTSSPGRARLRPWAAM